MNTRIFPHSHRPTPPRRRRNCSTRQLRGCLSLILIQRTTILKPTPHNNSMGRRVFRKEISINTDFNNPHPLDMEMFRTTLAAATPPRRRVLWKEININTDFNNPHLLDMEMFRTTLAAAAPPRRRVLWKEISINTDFNNPHPPDLEMFRTTLAAAAPLRTHTNPTSRITLRHMGSLFLPFPPS